MINPMLICDFYKLSHRIMYPEGTQYVYSTWTPRDSRIEGIDSIVVFGLQAVLKALNYIFQNNFFNLSEKIIVDDYTRIVSNSLGIKNPEVQHIKDLHRLGYLPLMIRALQEGSIVPVRTPIMTIQNTDPKFFWLTNYIETFLSCTLWQSCTSATIANHYRELFEYYAMKTIDNTDFVPFQGHDFSMRGMSSLSPAISSAAAHLTSFVGTDTILALNHIEENYNADITQELIGCSIPASEHSIQCCYENDEGYIRHIITNIHPTGPVSIVCDGYDYWHVISHVLPKLKNEIMNRDGKLVIRPDSGDPIEIVCGTGESINPEDSYYEICRKKGSIWALANIFGTTDTNKGYKQLDSHIGLIYGDAITYDRAKLILSNLEEQSFASNNIVFGIGSFTYQYNTRDTFGFALKSTLCVINGEEKQIFKNPKTDNGIKKSQKGRVAVFKDKENNFTFKDGYSLTELIPDDELCIFYRDGVLFANEKFSNIRKRIKENSKYKDKKNE